MTSELVQQLIEKLNEDGVNYCHWKSNYALSRGLAGETDLDLLVDRKFLAHFVEILLTLGFKPAIVRARPETPGVSHFYGFDQGTEQLIHIHLFCCVLTGESFVKSHLLPIEHLLLENTEKLGTVRVPSKTAELIIYILRTYIKYGSLLDLIYLRRNEGEIREEFHWLMSGADLQASLALLENYIPMIGEPLFIQCIETLNETNSIVKRISLAHQVKRRLSAYSRYSKCKRILVYWQLLWERAWRYLRGNNKEKTLPTAGAMIAFVGPEATGKSTLVSACGQWLGNVFAVRLVHAGKPPSTWLTAPINLCVAFTRRLLPRFRISRLEGHSATINTSQSKNSVEGLKSLIYALRAVTTAWDRRSLLQKAKRFAANGGIVICDRYPSAAIGAMDSPRLREDQRRCGLTGSIYNACARIEHRLYQQISPADIVLRLNVSIETAKKRNRERIKAGKESDAYIESRHRQSIEWRRSGTGSIFDIDTEQTEAQTILSVKKILWESL